jgi:GNAT superfamily N-acetyltransferase
VVTTRGGVHYVVTEYGIAYLHGKSIRERAMALIQVAHPDHRAELLAHAKERRYVFMDQEPPRSDRYHDELERHITLEDGRMVLFRPLRPTDDPLVRDLFYDTSENAVYQRFMSAKQTYRRDEREAIVNVDYHSTMSIAAARWGPGPEELVALAEWRLPPHDDHAEVAFLVRDDWQHRGLGTRLLTYLMELGMEEGLKGFRAEVLLENQGMLHVFQQSSQQVRVKLVDGAYDVLIEFDPEERSRRMATRADPSPPPETPAEP